MAKRKTNPSSNANETPKQNAKSKKQKQIESDAAEFIENKWELVSTYFLPCELLTN